MPLDDKRACSECGTLTIAAALDGDGMCEDCRASKQQEAAPEAEPQEKEVVGESEIVCGVPEHELETEDIAFLKRELAQFTQLLTNPQAVVLVQTAVWESLQIARLRRRMLVAEQRSESGELKAAEVKSFNGEAIMHQAAYKSAMDALNVLPKQGAATEQYELAMTTIARRYIEERNKRIEESGAVGKMSPEAVELAESRGLDPHIYEVKSAREAGKPEIPEE